MSLRYAQLGDLAVTRLNHFSEQLIALSERRYLDSMSDAEHARYVDALITGGEEGGEEGGD